MTTIKNHLTRTYSHDRLFYGLVKKKTSLLLTLYVPGKLKRISFMFWEDNVAHQIKSLINMCNKKKENVRCDLRVAFIGTSDGKY